MKRWAIEERGDELVIRLIMVPPNELAEELERYGYRPWWTKRIYSGKGHREEIERVLTAWNTRCENRTVAEERKETLCWSCALSGYGDLSDCEWERTFTPVEGWTAERHEKHLYTDDDGMNICTETYMVT